MQKIGILTDTTCDLDLEYLEQKNIRVIPLQIIFNDGRTFKDKFEISYQEVMDSLETCETKTSLPTIQETIDALDSFVEEGYTHVLTFMLASTLSGTFNMVQTVSKEYEDKLIINNIDSKSVTVGNGHFIKKAQAMIEEGKSFEEISQYMDENIQKQEIFLSAESLKHLIRGGRVGKVAGFVGEALDIKPVLHIDREANILPKERVRGRKKSIVKIADMHKEAAKGKEMEKLYVLHGDRMCEAETLKERLEEIFDCPIEIFQIGSLVSVHVGPGLIGAVAIYK